MNTPTETRCINSLTGCETTVDGVPKHLYRQEYVSPVSGGSPSASEKGICWRGTPSRAHHGGRQLRRSIEKLTQQLQ